jgi:L-malate glycosyltransferase
MRCKSRNFIKKEKWGRRKGMKVLHLISGGETGGSRKHVITLLSKFPKDQVVLAVFQEGALAEEARKAGIRVELFLQSSRYDLSILKRLVAFIKSEKFDIIHTHGPRANLFGIYLHKKTKVKWLTTVHSDPSLDFIKSGVKGRIFTNLHLYAVKKMDYYFAVSERFKENLIKLGIERDKVQTVYNGIDFTEEKAEPLSLGDRGVKDTDFVMTMVARLHPIKGHDIVFNALKNINNPSVKLLLVGDGPIQKELERMVQDLNLRNQVYFLGFRHDVDQLYASSHLGLLASHSESFPLALLEAANQRIPILTTDVGGVGELVSPKETGWIVPVKDTEAYEMAIRDAFACYQDNQLSGMGEKLYDYASTTFSLENLYKTTKQVYFDLIDKN